MSQHVVVTEDRKFVFGWDQPLMSFFLQVHDITIEEEDEQILHRFGASPETQMYEVDHLVQVAAEHGWRIDHRTQMELYTDKDEGR